MTAPNLFTKRHLVAAFAVLTALVGLLFFPVPATRGQQLNPANPAPADSHPEMVLQQGHRRPVSRIMFLPDQKLVASVDGDDRLIFWEIASGEPVRIIQVPEFAHLDEIGFSGDGLKIEFANSGGGRMAYDLKSGKPVADLAALCPEGSEPKKTAPNGKLAVCAKSPGPSGEIQDDSGHFLWDITNQRRLSLIEEKPSNWPFFQFSQDSRFLAVSQGEMLRILNVSSGATIRKFQGLDLAGFSADGRSLYLSTPPAGDCGCDGKPPNDQSDLAVGGAIEIWDLASTKLKRRLAGRQLLGFSPDGKTVLLRRKPAYPKPETLEFWDEEMAAMKQQISGAFRAFRFSPDGRMAILEAEPVERDEINHDISLYDWRAGVKKAQLWEDKPDVVHYAFSADGSTITTVSLRRVAKLRDGQSGATLKTLRLAPPPSREAGETQSEKPFFSYDPARRNFNLVISDDGQIVCGAQETQVLIADLRTSRVIRTAEGMRQSRESAFLFLQAGADQLVAQTAADLPVVIWNLKTLQAQPAPRPPSDPAQEKSGDGEEYVELSPDGKLRAERSKDKKSVAIVDAATNKQLRLLQGHSGLITDMTFSPDGKTLLTKSGFPSMGIDEKAMLLFSTMMANEKEKENIGQKLEAIRGDRTFRLWNVESGEMKRTFQFKGDLHEAKFLGDGGQVVTLHTEEPADQNTPGQTIATVWDSLTGKTVNTIKAEPGFTLTLSPDGSLTISHNRQQVSALETRTGKSKWAAPGLALSPLNDPFIADGKFLAVTPVNDFEFRLVEAQTGRERFRLPVDDFFFRPDVSADGRMLLLIIEKTARFWDLKDTTRQWSAKVMGGSRGAAFSPDGRIAVLQADPETLELRDAVNGRLMLSLSILPGEQADKAEWIARTPAGYYSASPGASRYIRWRVGDKLLPAEAYAREFNRPDLALKALQMK